MRARAYVPSLMECHDVAHFRRAVSVWLALPQQLRQPRDVRTQRPLAAKTGGSRIELGSEVITASSVPSQP
jgi:hypothetical protein